MSRTATSLIAAALVATALTLSLCGAAEARPLIGGDGKIHACYRVKGKPRGTLRVVKSAKVHCRHGERRVAWTAVIGGAKGAPGHPGAQGPAGPPGPPASTSLLEARIAALTAKVESLEGLLQGITRTELLAAINAVANVNALCGQAKLLTEQSNSLLSGLDGLSLNGVLTALGGVLNIPTLPEPLAAFSCTA